MIRRSKLNLEPLESRQMMAGDVSAYAISRILYINGDPADNGIALVDGGNGTFNLIGLTQGGAATTVNGGVSQNFNKIKDIVISMNKGNDAVVVTDIFVNGNLYVSGGKGNDVIGLGEFADTGLVDDAVDSLLGALSVKKSMVIDAGEENDALLARAVSAKTLTASMGAGNDVVTFDAGAGAGVTIEKTASISTSTGDDTVNLTRVSAAKGLTVSTTTGNDDVTLSEIAAKSLSVSLGSEDDDVTIDGSTITKTGTFNGDSGINSYTDGGGNTFGKLVRKNFQTMV